MSISILTLGFCLRFAACMLNIIWNLVFVIWDFIAPSLMHVLNLTTIGVAGSSMVRVRVLRLYRTKGNPTMLSLQGDIYLVMLRVLTVWSAETGNTYLRILDINN